MRFRTLILRSLRFHWRGHLGVLLGAAVGSASLIGALVVGDSVRESLRERALERLGWVEAAMDGRDRFFPQKLAERVVPISRSSPQVHNSWNFDAVLKLPGTASRQDGTARANQVNILGVGYWSFWQSTRITNAKPAFALIPKGSVVLNEALAAQLHARPGDEIILRMHKPTALSREVPITPQSDAAVALRLKVHGIAPAAHMGNFDLHAGQAPPLNAFLLINDLARAAGLEGKANLILNGDFRTYIKAEKLWRQWWHRLEPHLPGYKPVSRMVPQTSVAFSDWRLAWRPRLGDFSLQIRVVTNQSVLELRSDRIFLEPAIIDAVFAPPTNSPSAEPLPFWAATWISPGPPATNFAGNQLVASLARPVLTYFVNQFRAGDRSTPYSMVTAAGSPWTPAEMRDDEIIINHWLADDLQLKTGDTLSVTYFLTESGAQLVERTNHFRVHSVVPLTGLHGDRTLMPEFPGLAKAESTHEWDAGFPLTHKIRDQDDQYWKDYRGTPKAFVTLRAGQAMWGSRFGNLTAIRFPLPADGDAAAFRTSVENTVTANLNPESLGLRFEPVRAQALAGAKQSQDFGGLFIGFSFFLILAALILMALMFQFGIEQRLAEIGTLLALGFTPGRVRLLLLGEGIAVAFVGGLIGIAGGVAYAKAMLYGLTTLWRDAVGTSALQFHATPVTLIIGLFASVVVCAITIWLVLRKQARRPARELMADGADLESQIANRKSPTRGIARWIAIGFGGTALAMIGWAVVSGDSASAGLFFGAGAMLLIAELAAVAVLLAKLDRSEAGQRLSVSAMGLRNCTRRRSRSLASVALLACGSFLVAAIGANRLDAGRDATKRSSGTGGFALFGESTLPVVRDLNTQSGREFFSLDDATMKGVSVVPFRVRDGDDASCLNLNRAQTPRLLGVKPELLAERKAFTFAKVFKGLPATNAWMLLKGDVSNLPRSSRGNEAQESSDGTNSQSLVTSAATNERDDVIPAIGDAASIQWALGKKLGDTIEFTDERGQKFKVRLFAGVANSILQGSLIIDEAEFTKRFPGESGHRMFLIDTPSNTRADVDKVSATLSRALQDVGLELTPTTQRLAAFNAVQNTYLNTFQVLGGLGLLLGSAGLGVVVLRNVLERRGELGLLQAVGFRRRTLQWLVLSEHAGLLWLGLGVGITAALAAVLPALLAPGAEVHYVALGVTLATVFVSGLAWTWFATRMALRGELLKALRNE